MENGGSGKSGDVPRGQVTKDAGPGPLVPALCPAARGNDKPPWRRTGVLSREGTAPRQSLSPGDRRAPLQSAMVPCVLLWGWDEIQKSMRNGTETNKGGRTKSFSPLERDRKDYYNWPLHGTGQTLEKIIS